MIPLLKDYFEGLTVFCCWLLKEVENFLLYVILTFNRFNISFFFSKQLLLNFVIFLSISILNVLFCFTWVVTLFIKVQFLAGYFWSDEIIAIPLISLWILTLLGTWNCPCNRLVSRLLLCFKLFVELSWKFLFDQIEFRWNVLRKWVNRVTGNQDSALDVFLIFAAFLRSWVISHYFKLYRLYLIYCLSNIYILGIMN